ncbi:hypothetical protein [Rhizobium sp. BK379]|uniref:hypothetical protein n=1 Tax=Rhizobium sp. BK379 TaxID=2587059 RepID=UPI001615AF34|nr:hypothetical protein [Rhizobium sp. BK379]MBB3441855.1 hypothetical protein [Rhizobium sp. BK379]
MLDSASGNERLGVHARELARRFEGMGIDAFASRNERYLVLLQDSPGEIIDLGKPLRGTRIFGTHATRKNIPLVADFVDFARADGLADCMFWCIGLPGHKATPDDLTTAMKTFNCTINTEFSELRKRHSFEVLLIAIHPRFDHQTGLFDLHAHFVCRVPPGHREAVHRRLMTKFSKIDLRTAPIRNAAAVSTYMLWGIWRNKDMLTWPDHALQSAWSLTQHRFRFFRTGGVFAKWRSSRPASAAQSVPGLDKAAIQRNRQDTAYSRQPVQTGDRLLSRVRVRFGGTKIAALLFETQSMAPLIAEDVRNDRAPECSSATIVATQEVTSANDDASEERCEGRSGTSQKAATTAPGHTKSRISKIWAKAAEIVRLIGIRIKSIAAVATAARETRFANTRRKHRKGPNQLDEQVTDAQAKVELHRCLRCFRHSCVAENTTPKVVSESSERQIGRLQRLAFAMIKNNSRL